jgi:ABC-type transport system involved in cytochrome c biogenesis permease subunit
MSHALLSWASHFYLFAAILYLAFFARSHPKVARAALIAVSIGFALHTSVVLQRFFAYTYTPTTSFAEGLSFFGWLVVGGFLFVQWRYRLPIIGVFATPLVVAVVLPAVLLRRGGGPNPVPEALKIAGMPVHIAIAFAGIAAFGLATGVAAAYLLLERQVKGKRFGLFFSRLPSLEVLDGIGNGLMRWGFVALTITLISGAYFAKQALSLVGWLVYAALVHARMFAGWRGRRAALLTMVGFVILFGSFVGLRIFPAGLHTGEFR